MSDELAANPANPAGIDEPNIGPTVDWLEPTRKPGPAYEALFWRAFLGEPTYALLDVLRALDMDGDGRVEIPVTIVELAALCGLGDRHTILGRKGTKKRSPQVGSLATLETLGLVSFTVEGPDKYHKRYRFLVATALPPLSPEQVLTLPVVLQRFHTRFVGVAQENDPNYYTKLWRRHSNARRMEFALIQR
jgi:hypothetical protein